MDNLSLIIQALFRHMPPEKVISDMLRRFDGFCDEDIVCYNHIPDGVLSRILNAHVHYHSHDEVENIIKAVNENEPINVFGLLHKFANETIISQPNKNRD